MSIKVCVVDIERLLRNKSAYIFMFIVNSQIQEMNIFQQTLVDLERTQQVIKKQLRVLFF